MLIFHETSHQLYFPNDYVSENPVGLISDDVIVCSKMQMQRSAEANDANDEDHEAKRH